jgi:hypothetical protein
MSVTAVSAISSYSQDPDQHQSGVRQDLLSLQQALSTGNLDSAQRALTRFQADLQAVRPQQNGIRASAEVNPTNTLQRDLLALQNALDSGDLAMAEEAFMRVLQDGQQAKKLQANEESLSTEQEHHGVSALPNPTNDNEDSALPNPLSKTNGNLLDVSA